MECFLRGVDWFCFASTQMGICVHIPIPYHMVLISDYEGNKKVLSSITISQDFPPISCLPFGDLAIVLTGHTIG